MRLLRLLGLLPIGRNMILSDFWFWTLITLVFLGLSAAIVWLVILGAERSYM